MIPVPAFFAEYQARIESELRRLAPGAGGRVQEAMAYTLLAPSKRVRPVLTLLSAELCGGDVSRALAAGAVVELVHAAAMQSVESPRCLGCLPSCEFRGAQAVAGQYALVQPPEFFYDQSLHVVTISLWHFCHDGLPNHG